MDFFTSSDFIIFMCVTAGAVVAMILFDAWQDQKSWILRTGRRSMIRQRAFMALRANPYRH